MYTQLLINHKLQANDEIINITKVLQQKNFKIQFVDTTKPFLSDNQSLFIGIDSTDNTLAQKLNLDLIFGLKCYQ